MLSDISYQASNRFGKKSTIDLVNRLSISRELLSWPTPEGSKRGAMCQCRDGCLVFLICRSCGDATNLR